MDAYLAEMQLGDESGAERPTDNRLRPPLLRTSKVFLKYPKRQKKDRLIRLTLAWWLKLIIDQAE